MELTPYYQGNVIGLDVHQKQVTATAIVKEPDGKTKPVVKVFSALMAGLAALAKWCLSLTPDLIVMESTGVYWICVHQAIFDEAGITPTVVNAQHVKNVKGRKTDTSDSLWLAKLARSGLLNASFVPTPEFRDIRSVARHRQKVVSALARAKNQLGKTLVEAGIKLGTVVSDIHGQAGRRMINCLIEGGSAEEALKLAGTRLKASPEDLLLALQGKLSNLRRELLAKIMDEISRLETEVADLDRLLLIALAPYREAIDLLITIPGVNEVAAAIILAEIGPDMEVFGSPERLASWAGMCPGNNESAGKRKGGKTRKGNKWVRRILCEAAQAAVKTKCSLQAKFQDLVRRRGYKRSIVAVGHKLLRIIFAILKKKEPYQDPNVDYEALMVKKNAPRWMRALRKYHMVPVYGPDGKIVRFTKEESGQPESAVSKPEPSQSADSAVPKPELSQSADSVLARPEACEPDKGSAKAKRCLPLKALSGQKTGQPDTGPIKPDSGQSNTGPVKLKRGRPKKELPRPEARVS